MADRNRDRMTSMSEIAGEFTVASLQQKLLQLGREAAARDKAANAPPVGGCGNCVDGWIVDRVRGSRRCECWLRARAMPGVPIDWRQIRLKDVERHPGNRIAVDAISKFVRRETTGPVCLSGGCGTGKTFLLVAAGNELFWSGDTSAFFLRFGDFIDAQLKAQNFKDDDAVAHGKRLISRARSAEPLVLDDLGAGAKDSDFTDQELLKLLERRKADGRRTLISTNLSVDDFGRLDDRIVSRLYGGEVITVTGRDRRLGHSTTTDNVVAMRGSR